MAEECDEIADMDCGDVLTGFVLIEMVAWFVLERVGVSILSGCVEGGWGSAGDEERFT